MSSGKKKSETNSPGRPRAFSNEEIKQKFLAAISIGSSVKMAASHAGIKRQTVYDEMARNPQLAKDIEEAKTIPYTTAIKTVFNNLHNPQLALNYLKLKHKDEFNSRIEIEGVMKLNPFGGRNANELRKVLNDKLKGSD